MAPRPEGGKDPRTGTTPQGRGRFDGFDVLSQIATWDAVTAHVVLSRLVDPGPLTFFTPGEEPTLRMLVDRLLDQDEEPRVPVADLLDARLAQGLTDGFRYADMPHDGEAWRRSLGYLDDDSRDRFGQRFHALSHDHQREIALAVQQSAVDDDSGMWHDLPAERLWSLWTRYAAAAFYSHPWAWNEIGFGGPAYPRGYKNLGDDAREGWETPETDARDPLPWVERVEASRARHGGALPPGAHSGPP